ncbi:putative ORFan [Tupanvirus deep ocean]|uniref:ORFan n=2 Tax=Tupanvirus TaxID=2094720 RepID=A0AC62A9R0_9VIRU|nr:putative ORFan [Tupanvirus deep ocean]QKU34517.1 putative ORFan [Tupanvirus deep ocean]
MTDTYLDVIRKGTCEKLKSMLDGDEYDVENYLAWIMKKVVEYKKSDMFKMIVLNFNFDVSEEFIKNNCQYFTTEILEFINAIKGNNCWDSLNNLYFSAIFSRAYIDIDKEIIVKLINYGININNLSNIYHTLHRSTNAHCELLKILLDNGLSHTYFDEILLSYFVRSKYDNLIRVLLQFNIDFNNLNQVIVPKNFNTLYDILIEANVNPKNLAYILSQTS